MFKKRTTNSRQRSRMRRLEVRVMSPRIAWFGFLRLVGKGMKLAVLLALLGAAGWGSWLGIEKVFFKNPEFQLKRILLNPNNALDEVELVRAGKIDLSANLFNLDLAAIRERLASRSEIEAVIVERHLPSTLTVTIEARKPRAWVAVQGGSPEGTRREGGTLVDASGRVFPCTRLQWPMAQSLPVIFVPESQSGQCVVGETLSSPELKRCFRLLDAALAKDSAASTWIERIEQMNAWSLHLTTRSGTVATFGFDNQARQMEDFITALDHASRQGYSIATISLIPQRNIPITLLEEPVAPRAIVVPEPSKEEIRTDRRSKDLQSLLNRN